jgi:hypothetical protein
MAGEIYLLRQGAPRPASCALKWHCKGLSSQTCRSMQPQRVSSLGIEAARAGQGKM